MPRTPIRNSILAGAAIAIAAAAIWWFRSGPDIPPPQIELVTIEGEKISTAELRGKVVLVNFWATDCAACIKEMPAMVETYRKFQSQSFEALFVAMPYDRPDHVVHFARTRSLPFKVALDLRGEVNRAFGGVKLTPTAFIVDKTGRIAERLVGEPDFARLNRSIERSLAAAD